jgi:pyruvate kinase
LATAFDHVRVGDRVWLDDGKIGGVARRNDGQSIEMEVTHVPPAGGKLRAEKGINFPDTDLRLGALTDKDLSDLRHVVQFADLVALSFVRTPEDVQQLAEQLRELDATRVGIVLKIENGAAFRNLPRILLASLRTPPVGVMVARGDLAVEVGFERLSEVQEEILWLCEAAHVPVVWATQVLEGLAKGGAPSRAEVSDAVMSSRAECVMLNKGPRVVSTVKFLSDVLERMEEHHDKRMALLRRLSVSEI